MGLCPHRAAGPGQHDLWVGEGRGHPTEAPLWQTSRQAACLVRAGRGLPFCLLFRFPPDIRNFITTQSALVKPFANDQETLKQAWESRHLAWQLSCPSTRECLVSSTFPTLAPDSSFLPMHIWEQWMLALPLCETWTAFPAPSSSFGQPRAAGRRQREPLQ